MLLLPEQNLFFKKASSKDDLIKVFDFGHSKIVFTILDEAITVYIKLILGYI